MKRFPSQSLIAIAALAGAIGLMVHGGLTLEAQDGAGAAKQTTAPGGAGRGTGAPKGGGGRGRAAVDTLGEGPWDLKSEKANIHVSVVTKGLDHPWGLAILPNGDMLVTERAGRLRLVHKGVLDPACPLVPCPKFGRGASVVCWISRCILSSRRTT